MNDSAASRAIAIVGVSAILPDAPNAATFWDNVCSGRYSISDVPEGRWDPERYYDPDPKAPDKTYSRIGGWVKDWTWDPHAWKLPIPPKISDAMDDAQKWAVACAYMTLADYGDDQRPLNRERTAVILGNAMGGEMHNFTTLRVMYPEIVSALECSPAFADLDGAMQTALVSQLHAELGDRLPGITEDTMPGELSNCMAGRVANLFNFQGPNYVCDAACASAMAAIDAAVEGLVTHEFDAALVGGVDRNMGASTYVKFCKIGALSATGTRPYADGADGFVMGEGAALFLLKRLADAEASGDRIYAVLRGVGGSSDGKGKGITAPNPKGQQLALKRAWANAGLDPSTVTLIEGHGTSTRVGDVVEVESLNAVFGANGVAPGSIALGSVKSNIGHLKSGAGAAGMLKAVLALHHRQLPPSLNFAAPNPNIDFSRSPFAVNTELRDWPQPGNSEGVRRAGLSAFGFGGTNFHAVFEEYIPGRLKASTTATVAGADPGRAVSAAPAAAPLRAPLQGILVLGAADVAGLRERVAKALADADRIGAEAPRAPDPADLAAAERLAISYGSAAELASRARRALQAFDVDDPVVWKTLQNQGVFRGSGAAPKVAFMFTGQGSQYANMLADLRAREPIVADVFAEADRVMQPLLGRPLSEFIFVDGNDEAAVKAAEAELRKTEITQPAVLAVDDAMTRMFRSYGIVPDMVMGHSLGEYGALVAADAMPFEQALEAVSARGREMTQVSIDDNGAMAAVFAPLEQIEQVVASTEGNVVIANINSRSQAVIGGATAAVQAAAGTFEAQGVDVVMLPVSHAFHTSIVAPASGPLREVLERMSLKPPRIPMVANVTGEFYSQAPDSRAAMVDCLARQVASPVQFVKGLETLYEAGARVFVEVGPKKALQGFAEDVLGDRPGVLTLSSNHPKLGGLVSFNHALAGLYAAGLGAPRQPAVEAPVAAPAPAHPVAAAGAGSLAAGSDASYREIGRRVADLVTQQLKLQGGAGGGGSAAAPVVSGAALGLPGTERVFDEGNVARILSGEQGIDVIPTRFRQAMVDKHITRLVKEGSGEPHFETIGSSGDVIKLAGRKGSFDLCEEFGVPQERVGAYDITTALAIGAGIDALRDAGIPLTMHYQVTTRGTRLPVRYMLPESMRDDTGIIYASCFPGLDAFADEVMRYQQERDRELELEALQRLRDRFSGGEFGDTAQREIERQIHELKRQLDDEPYDFDRRFLFRVLAMGHSQMAEYIGARGPNTQINSACASSTQAFSLAEDWIRAGRCRRVLVVAADDVTSDHLLEWMGAGFLATGAAATDEDVSKAALPFDRRRHGMIMGMGACGVVLERPDSAAERGIRPICEVLSTVTANSAFHGTRLDVNHICSIMETVVSQAEARHGIDRRQIAGEMMFMSHETYTPARGGSASAEVHALRETFGDVADRIVIANTKGFTGHAMGVGIEDTVAIKALETGVVPPVANFQEVDPELGELNLSRGGAYPVRYALRLGAGFGSQISMSLMRWVDSPDGTRPAPDRLGYHNRLSDPARYQSWVAEVSGEAAPELEVVQRTLRVRSTGAGQRSAPATAAPTAPAPAPAPAPAAETAAAPGPAPTATGARSAPAAAPAPAAAAPAVDEVTARVLAIVAEKTGYPTDMLDPELDLEADLGIDTVKQAETFAAIRAEWDIPRDENMKLRDYPTIAAAVGFVRERANLPEPASAPAQVTAPAVASAPAPTGSTAAPAPGGAVDEVTAKVLAIVAEKTGYPTDMLDPELDLEADLGIDTVKQAETFAAIRAEWDIPRDENIRLRDYPTIAAAVGFVRERANLPEPAGAPAAPMSPTAAAGAAPAPTAPESIPSASPAPGGAVDEVTAKVLAIVAEKTGYPTDMLDPELDLEADLGIDTVKQAETFAAIRAEWDIPRDENLQLREYPTIAAAVGFVRERANLPEPAGAPAAAAAAAGAAPAPEADTAASGAVDDITARVMAIVADKTGYPTDMLDPELDLEADLGIDTVKQAETFAAIRAEWDIPRDENLQLREYPTIAAAVGFVRERANLPEAASAPAAPMSPTAAAGAAPAPTAPESIPSASPASAAAMDDITARVMAIVADKTGYPTDMLDPELDLEADLGIDTVKQAETFAAIRAEWDIPRDENLQLRDYPTIAAAVGFVRERAPAGALDGAGPAPGAAAGTADGQTAHAADTVRGDMAATEALPRRGPRAVLRPPLDVCKETGVTLGEGQRVIVMPDAGGVGAALIQRLQKRGVEVLELDASLDRTGLRQRIEGWLAEGAVDGLYWLPALDVEQASDSLDAWRDQLEQRVKLLSVAARTLYDSLAGGERFLVSATRLGGRHGYDDAGAASPMGGAVTGFTKAFAREREATLVKAVDFGASRKTAALADLLIEETLRDPGAVEIGYCEEQRWTVALMERPIAGPGQGMTLDGDSVYAITGAAGSIVAAITADLAMAGGTFYLLDLAPEPDPDDPDIRQVAADRDGLKRTIFERLKAAGERATPAAVEKQIAGVERAASALAAVESVRAAGGTPVYCQVDLTDSGAVAAVIDRIRQDHGRLDVLLHAAGLEISKPLVDKPEPEFDLVFDVKCNGWFNLLHAIGDMPLGAVVVFSSIAGRFGNMGQTDYSAANDLLCKSMSAMRSARPETRGLALDWTAWADIGMASRGSIPQIMAAAGIDMLAPAAGIPLIRRELTAGDGRGELVVAGALGILQAERDATGGLDPAAVGGLDRWPMLGSVTGMTLAGGLEVSTELDPGAQPFLDHHRIDGTAVLPGVMAVEAFSELALLQYPDRALLAAEDVDFLAPLKFYRDEPQTLLLNAQFEVDGDELLAHCRCRSSRLLHGRDEPQLTTHFRATIRLGRERAAADTVVIEGPGEAPTLLPEHLYRVYFHGPAYQVVGQAWATPDGMAGAMPESLPQAVLPEGTPLVAAPRLVELCFQVAGAWEIGSTGRMALPSHIERIRFFADDEIGEGLRATVLPLAEGAGFDAAVADAGGQLQVALEGYRSSPLPGTLDEDSVAPLRALVQ